MDALVSVLTVICPILKIELDVPMILSKHLNHALIRFHVWRVARFLNFDYLFLYSMYITERYCQIVIQEWWKVLHCLRLRRSEDKLIVCHDDLSFKHRDSEGCVHLALYLRKPHGLLLAWFYFLVSQTRDSSLAGNLLSSNRFPISLKDRFYSPEVFHISCFLLRLNSFLLIEGYLFLGIMLMSHSVYSLNY